MTQNKIQMFRVPVLLVLHVSAFLVMSRGIYSMSLDIKPKFIAGNPSNPLNIVNVTHVVSIGAGLIKDQQSTSSLVQETSKVFRKYAYFLQ